MVRVLGGLILSAVIVGTASGVIFFEVVGLIITLPLAIAVAVVLGTPTYFLLRKLGWLAWWQVTLSGALLVVPFALYAYPYWNFVAGIIGSGAVAALLFWFFGIGPNNSFKPTPLRGAA
ncbi:hypothetical protein QFW80_00075 [Luteimonas sp. M1R5S18]|uniref:SPW repeat-containing protein n=1 Tax=Luteimonas rhizosphaericola TaxID=3042024 RepID=A0ABT6JE30_9GAMM|nr:hypothetical protein [Luteimonas rhizosphaericola]MDH5828920.1 hypothetical protein [Luteimonas rhizosphaericola]